MLKQRTGIDLLHVNYKGGSAALTGILGGEAHAGFVPLATAWPMVQSGKIVAVAISSMTRFPTLPQVPTLHESGVPHFLAASWFGMFAPRHTSRALIARLNEALVGILRAPPVQRDLLNIGAEANPGTPEEFGAFLRSEIGKWRTVIQTAGIRPQS
jgi:tripartite-type tricarboxylate transporter receptor subunit TctC